MYDSVVNGFLNMEVLAKNIKDHYYKKVLMAKLLNQKRGIEFLTSADTLDEADTDILIQLLQRKQKSRKG